MFLIKLIGKILLLPVVLLLAILRLLVKIGMEVSSFILGALMLIVFGCIIFTIVGWRSRPLSSVLSCSSCSAASSLPSCSTPGIPWRS